MCAACGGENKEGPACAGEREALQEPGVFLRASAPRRPCPWKSPRGRGGNECLLQPFSPKETVCCCLVTPLPLGEGPGVRVNGGGATPTILLTIWP